MIKRPKILGIVNITTNSFSDGGHYLKAENAIEHALTLIQHGADIIDLGPSSSHPHASPISAEIEIQRIAPVIAQLKKHAILLSIDSYHTPTQQFALQQSVAFLNDIHGFNDPTFYPTLAESTCQLIMMHAIRSHESSHENTSTIFNHMLHFFEMRLNQLEKAGISRDRIILDPGLGFFLSTQPAPSLFVLQQLSALKKHFQLPVLISASRKSFLQKITHQPVEKIGPATLAAEIYAMLQGVDYIRTHDVCALSNALTVFEQIELSTS